MIDLHSHILPGIDDGAKDMRQSLDMLRVAIFDGIKTIVATPHVLGRMDSELNNKIVTAHKQLVQAAKDEGLQIEIRLGAEIYMSPEWESAIEYPCCTFEGKGKYMLMEFAMNEVPYAYDTILRQIVDRGIVPIIAHPERNYQINRRMELAQYIIDTGAVLQINSGSVIGKFGRRVKKVAFAMMRNDMVYIVASDAHNPRSRPPMLSPACELIIKNFDEEYAENLTIYNPEFILETNKNNSKLDN